MSPPSPDREPSIDATGTFQSPPIPTHVDQICDRFVRDWRSGHAPRIEEYLSAAPEAGRSALLLELLREELALRKQSDESVKAEEYLSRFPADRETVTKAFALTDERSGLESTFNAIRSSVILCGCK